MIDGFTKKYNIKMLVYDELHANAENALTREKQIRKWRSAWKLELIAQENPYWKDLYAEIV